MLQQIGFYLRIGGPSLVVVAAGAKLLLAGPDPLNVAVFVGAAAYGFGRVIEKYF